MGIEWVAEAGTKMERTKKRTTALFSEALKAGRRHLSIVFGVGVAVTSDWIMSFGLEGWLKW